MIEKEENSDEILPADTIIFAVGQHPEVSEAFGLPLERGRIVADDTTWATPVKGIYAAGDCVTGTRSVILSIAEARTVVSEIDKYLGEILTKSLHLARMPIHVLEKQRRSREPTESHHR